MTLETLLPSQEMNPADATLDLAIPVHKLEPAAGQNSQMDDLPLPAAKGYFGSVFWSTFITIFLAELGDKTQVTTLLMSAESHQPWVVFMGAASALVATSLLGVLLGRWLSKRISPRLLDTLAGVMLLLITVSLVADVLGV